MQWPWLTLHVLTSNPSQTSRYPLPSPSPSAGLPPSTSRRYVSKPAPLFSSLRFGQMTLLKMCVLKACMVLGSPASFLGRVPGRPAVLMTKPEMWSRCGWVMRKVSTRAAVM